MTFDAVQLQQLHLGLGAAQKTLPSAWFYDDEGSRLFQRIMALPEYYLTRIEQHILRSRGAELVALLAPQRQNLALVELGSGDGEKTLDLCCALQDADVPCTYYPMDLSALALAALQQRFAQHLPSLPVQPLEGDYFAHWPAVEAGQRQVAMLMGSNLGNLNQAQAVQLLRRIHQQLRPGDLLLLGLDLMKDPHTILAAYNDPQGVTAAFNLNLLVRLNRELGMNFDLQQFRHYASYNPLDGAARSFLVSLQAQQVQCPPLGQNFDFAAGETIYTEQSQKYSPAMVAQLAVESGFAVAQHLCDPKNWYTVALLQAQAASTAPADPS
jgi:dimethylhistidine N-methyltransferase